MKTSWLIMTVLASVIVFRSTSEAKAQNTADATMALTFTLTDVRITDTLTGSSRSALFENTENGVGDLLFEDMGPNGTTYSGGSPSNPPGSIGSGSSSETVLLNGLDPFEAEFDMDSFDIGDSLSTTMIAAASSATPGAVFFGQVNSENVLYFSVYGEETDQFTFLFDYSARLTGTLENLVVPGATLAFGDGNAVDAVADTTISGTPNSFTAVSDYFSLGTYHSSVALAPLDEIASGSFEVAFAPGDRDLRITFLSSLIVNAGIEAVPEPSAIAMLAGVGLAISAFNHRRRR